MYGATYFNIFQSFVLLLVYFNVVGAHYTGWKKTWEISVTYFISIFSLKKFVNVQYIQQYKTWYLHI